MASDAATKLILPLIPWYIPLWFPKIYLGKQASGQGMGKHTPEEVRHIGQLDLSAIAAFIGNGLTMCI